MNTTPKKPREKELRISDWMSSKSAASSVAAPPVQTEEETFGSAPAAIAAPQTAPKPAQKPNGAPSPVHSPSTAPGSVLSQPRYQPRQTATLEPPTRMSAASGVVTQHRQQHPAPAEAPPVAPVPPPAEGLAVEPLPFDAFRFLGSLVEHRRKILTWAFFGLALGLTLGMLRGDSYSASMMLMIRDVPTAVAVEGGQVASPSYKPKDFDKQTLTAILTSDALLKRVGPKLTPPTGIRELKFMLKAEQTRNADYIELTYRGGSTAENAVNNANVWGEEAVTFTKELQSRETEGTRVYLHRQGLQENINRVKAELTSLRSQYSDGNPLVREKVAQIEWLEQRFKDLDQQPSIDEQAGTAVTQDDPQRNVLGYFSVLSSARLDTVKPLSKWLKGILLGSAGFIGFFLISACVVLAKESTKGSVRTAKELGLALGTKAPPTINRLTEGSAGSSAEIASFWTRTVGASPHELVCFWTPYPHEQPHILMQSLLNLASRREFPLVWVETEGETVEPPKDFQHIDFARLGQPLEPGRYRIKLDIHRLGASDVESTAATLASIASRHRIPVWVGIHGQIMETGCMLARNSHRIKILAALHTASRDFWKIQGDVLRQSVSTPAEWLAVNHLPWYQWSRY